MLCRKCSAPGTLFIRKEYIYCNDCFTIYINHKFRACLGKNKTSNDEKVLICLSGDAKSTVLLDLVYNGISLDNHKKLRVFPYLLHIIENNTEDGINIANILIDQCKKYNFDLHIVNMNEYTRSNDFQDLYSNLEINCPFELSRKNNLNLGLTTKNDLNMKLKQNIYVKIAKEVHCKIIFTAETTTVLATRLLSNIALGRGSQIENDTGFADNRNEDVKILRPMRDITNEEIEHYIRINKLFPAYVKIDKENSLQSVIASFVLDLQENYPSTVSTICKTADKIASHDNPKNQKKCLTCQSSLDVQKPNITALDATMFSREVSFRKFGEESNFEDPCLIKDKNSMFPFIFESLCYCCSRNCAELNNCIQKPNI